MTAIGLVLAIVAFIADAAYEVHGRGKAWVENVLAFVALIGVVLMSCGFVIWIWRAMP